MVAEEIVGYLIIGALLGFTGGMFLSYLWLCQMESAVCDEISGLKKRIGWLTVRQIDRGAKWEDEFKTPDKGK